MSKKKKKHEPKTTTALVSWSQIATAKGYKVFWGTNSRSYPYSQDVGTNLSYRVPDLQIGTTYYFAGKAYNNAEQSPYSNEVKRQL